MYKQGSHVCTRAAFLSARIRLGGWVSIRKNTPERIRAEKFYNDAPREARIPIYIIPARSLLLAREALRVCVVCICICE